MIGVYAYKEDDDKEDDSETDFMRGLNDKDAINIKRVIADYKEYYKKDYELKKFLYKENGLDSEDRGFKVIAPLGPKGNICAVFGKSSKSSDVSLHKDVIIFEIPPIENVKVTRIKLSQVTVTWNKGTKDEVKRVYRNRSYKDNKKIVAELNDPFRNSEHPAYFIMFSVQNEFLVNEHFCNENGPTYDEFLVHLTFKTKSIKKIYYNMVFIPTGNDKEALIIDDKKSGRVPYIFAKMRKRKRKLRNRIKKILDIR